MPTLSVWYVMYGVKENDFEREIFQCQAEDRGHAVEQAQDAYPDCKIFSASKVA